MLEAWLCVLLSAMVALLVSLFGLLGLVLWVEDRQRRVFEAESAAFWREQEALQRDGGWRWKQKERRDVAGIA